MLARPLALLLALASLRGPGARAVDVSVNTVAAAGAPPALGLGWEMWVMFGYYSDMVDQRFISALAGLAGTRVRVGGITADWTRYVMSEGAGAPPAAPLARSPARRAAAGPFWPTEPQNFTAGHLRTLLGFMAAANLSVVFDLNELYGRNCSQPAPQSCYVMDEWCEGPWDTSNVRSFLQYLHDARLAGAAGPITHFELGNELACHLNASTTLADVAALAGMVQAVWSDTPPAARPGLFAPSTDSCAPSQLEVIAGLAGIPGVTGASIHSYPGGDGVHPPLASLLLNETWLRTRLIPKGGALDCIDAWRAAAAASGLQLWVTESSSSYAIDVPAPAQNSFLNGFFSLAEWGACGRVRARRGARRGKRRGARARAAPLIASFPHPPPPPFPRVRSRHSPQASTPSRASRTWRAGR